MSKPIEDYAMIGDLYTSALVASDGAIDWLCLPRLDSDACFAALLGTPDNGHWTVAPTQSVVSTARSYVGNSLVLRTDMTTTTGQVRITDFMPVRDQLPIIIRIVSGISGSVTVRSTFSIRFGYGHVEPFLIPGDHSVRALAGPDGILHVTPRPAEIVGHDAICEFTVEAGQELAFQTIWHRSWRDTPIPVEPFFAERACLRWWEQWVSTATYEGEYREAVVRSLVTLKALTYAPTGAIAAAATTSLPESLGGVRNWDYRYTWLRDASMTLQALMDEGYRAEALEFRGWVLRAIAGDPAKLQIMYSITGKRHLPEWEVPWLSGYEGSRPVRVGNAAAEQFQLDVYGELIDAATLGRSYGLTSGSERGATWQLQVDVAKEVERHWRNPDEGIWEVRGQSRHFTYSKVMAWVAFDRMARAVTDFGLAGDATRWQALADEVHAQVCERAVDPERGCFTQYYGSTSMDASLLMLPLVGFLPPDDPRIVSTIHHVRDELMNDGLLLRYRVDDGHDGLAGDEGAFLICTFWLVQCLALIGEKDEARELFERLLSLRNDVGLLSEEYDTVRGRQLGNTPQAFSHIGLINAAHALAAD